MLTNDAREQIKTAVLAGLGEGESFIDESEDKVLVQVYAQSMLCEFTIVQHLGMWEVHGEVKPWKSRFDVSELAEMGAKLSKLALTMASVESTIYTILRNQRVRISYPTLRPVMVQP
jgi:hypothetical protein